MATVAQLPDESLNYGDASAGLGEIGQNYDEISSNRSEEHPLSVSLHASRANTYQHQSVPVDPSSL